ncbi:hypothetical protein [Latilactobacillus sakei]|uniref:hypothetical protein n=1 Tax=Latilactobacillus sakei TaxID=1599 RepID=UPI003F53E535
MNKYVNYGLVVITIGALGMIPLSLSQTTQTKAIQRNHQNQYSKSEQKLTQANQMINQRVKQDQAVTDGNTNLEKISDQYDSESKLSSDLDTVKEKAQAFWDEATASSSSEDEDTDTEDDESEDTSEDEEGDIDADATFTLTEADIEQAKALIIDDVLASGQYGDSRDNVEETVKFKSSSDGNIEALEDHPTHTVNIGRYKYDPDSESLYKMYKVTGVYKLVQ